MGLTVVIWQQNINKLPTCQHTLLSNNILVKHDIDIVALQEPAINPFNNSIASRDWFSVYPTTHRTHPDKTHTLTLICTPLNTDSWEQIKFPSRDIVIITLKGPWGRLTIFNIYNDCKNNTTISQLKHFHRTRPDVVDQSRTGTAHTIWLGVSPTGRSVSFICSGDAGPDCLTKQGCASLAHTEQRMIRRD
jgi:hypothetical protein